MAIAYVNSATPLTNQSGTNIALGATSLTSGNLIVVHVRYNFGVTISSITDTAGNTYAQIDTQVLGASAAVNVCCA